MTSWRVQYDPDTREVTEIRRMFGGPMSRPHTHLAPIHIIYLDAADELEAYKKVKEIIG